jgi:cytidylate kinase
MPIVTISREFGSGGSAIAERVANALGWQLYDNAMVDAVAARLGISVEEVSAREERLPSLAERLAKAISLTTPAFVPSVSDAAAAPGEDQIVEMTKRVMEEAVSAGPAVIVGRGAQCLLALRADALHVFCYAPVAALVASTMTAQGLTAEEARKRVSETNNRRADYVKRYWQRDWRDVSNYHLCVNTAWLGVQGASELIVREAARLVE